MKIHGASLQVWRWNAGSVRVPGMDIGEDSRHEYTYYPLDFFAKIEQWKKNQVVYLYIEIRTPRQLYLNWCQFVKIPSFTSPGFDSTEDAPRRPGSFLQDAEILEILPMYLGNNSWRSRITVTRETKKSPKNLRKLWNYTPFCCKPTAKRHH